MTSSIPPGLIMIVGALLIPFLGRSIQAIAALGLAIASLVVFCLMPDGEYLNFELFGLTLNVIRIDRVSFLFGLIFHLAAILSAIYALHLRDARQHVAAMIYAGGAIGACCAGDMITLFVYWELTAISSVFLIWASDSERSYRSGMRYLIIQVTSGVLLLFGAIVRFIETGGVENGGLITFESMTPEDGPLGIGPLLILIAFGIKCAFPLLHNWLQDSYPEATVTGTVYLSAFTTKLAVYALVRGFPGTEPLIWVGCAMTLFPIVFAVIENDLRRVLAYSLNNQLGFMVVGVGIGSELAINGTVAHAFCHIIYKALLFMSMGAVLHRAGTVKATELGGLHKSMPLTTVFCMIGAGAISGFPLLSGFISKSMILTAAAEEHMLTVFILLLVASAGVMEHSGIKIPFFAFFAHDSGKRPREAPWNMLLAMGIAACLCVLLGVAYPLLYSILPSKPMAMHGGHLEPYHPYTVSHVVTQLQLLMFATLAFVVLMKSGLYPEEMRSTNLDTDWFYRKLAPGIIQPILGAVVAIDQSIRKTALAGLEAVRSFADSLFNESGSLGRTWSTGFMAVWATILLALFLLLYYTQ